MNERLLSVFAAGTLAAFVGSGLPDAAAAEEEGVDVGGAVRLNYALRQWDPVERDRGGEFDLELFRLDLSGRVDDVLLSAQYRFYTSQDFDTVHHAWIGYDFARWRAKLGIVQAPFGLLPYASHSWWLGLGYYLGLEDDYDAGLVFERRGDGPQAWQLAFFKQQELGSADPGRYSFDIVRGSAGGGDAAQQNEEINQFNARWTYTLAPPKGWRTELGVSGQYGDLYNRATRAAGHHWAAATHVDARSGPWNVQLQLTRYAYRPRNPAGVGNDAVQGAFLGFANLIPAEGTLYTFNIARDFAVSWGPVTKATLYNDFSLLRKEVPGWNDSSLNTLGALLTAGPVYAYVDLIFGKNATFLGPYAGSALNDSTRLLQGNGAREARFNINIGYYF